MSLREATSTAIRVPATVEVLRVGREFSVAAREAARGEREVELAVSRRQVPDGGGEEAARREVVGWERHPGRGVGRIGDEAAVELVQRISKTVQIYLVTVGVTSTSSVS